MPSDAAPKTICSTPPDTLTLVVAWAGPATAISAAVSAAPAVSWRGRQSQPMRWAVRMASSRFWALSLVMALDR